VKCGMRAPFSIRSAARGSGEKTKTPDLFFGASVFGFYGSNRFVEPIQRCDVRPVRFPFPD
jgi:hypothetical protein